jgi:Family of unknown function (DUF6084)
LRRLAFEVIDARTEPFAAVPTIAFRLRVRAEPPEVAAISLRAQIRIEARERGYSMAEGERLFDVFGSPHRFGETLSSLLWTQAGAIVPGFRDEVEVDLAVACTYDFDVTAAKYMAALDDGEMPLLFLFNGTVFGQSEHGLRVEPVPWECEARYRLPVRVWRELVERYFPGTAWLRLSRENLDRLQRFKAERTLATWDDVLEALLVEARERV